MGEIAFDADGKLDYKLRVCFGFQKSVSKNWRTITRAFGYLLGVFVFPIDVTVAGKNHMKSDENFKGFSRAQCIIFKEKCKYFSTKLNRLK